MNNNTTYKNSPLGKIPSDWEVRELGCHIDQLTNGLTYDPDSNSGFPITRIETIADGNINIEKTGLTPYFDSYEKFKLKKGEILYSHINSVAHIGKVAYCEKDYEILHGMNLLRLIPKSTVESKYLFYLLNSKYGKKHAYSSAKRAVNQASISTNEIKKFKFPFAPLPEQARIAEVLGTWDKAITNLQATITQKELRNKWLMQQLLTGEKRLKGFGGEWKKIHIHDVSKEVSLRNLKNKQLTVLSCTKYDGLVDSLEYWGRKIFSDDISSYKIVPENHFAYATNHIEEGSIGYQNVCAEALISPMYTVFKTDSNVNDDFFFMLLKSHRLIYEYNARMEGSIDRRGGLRWDAFSIIKINLPSFEEQTAIANVLQTASNDVQLLQKQLEKLREQKKGLMQVLLTGKKRLKI